MPVHRIESTATHVRLWKDKNVSSRTEIDIVQMLIDQGGAGNELKVAGVIKQLLQDSLDLTVARNTLPGDDPDKTTNPDLPWHFWAGGNITFRGVLVVDVVWDGTTYGVTLKRLGPR